MTRGCCSIDWCISLSRYCNTHKCGRFVTWNIILILHQNCMDPYMYNKRGNEWNQSYEATSPGHPSIHFQTAYLNFNHILTDSLILIYFNWNYINLHENSRQFIMSADICSVPIYILICNNPEYAEDVPQMPEWFTVYRKTNIG